MKGLSSKILIALGIVLILAAILWWAIAVNALVKLPDDIDSTSAYEGEITYFIDPASQAPLPPGEEPTAPMRVERTVSSLPDEYDSSRAVLEERVVVQVEGEEGSDEGLTSVFVLDRRGSDNVSDERAYDFVQENKVDRRGAYYPLLPFDVSRDESYPIWKGEIGEAVEAEFVDEQEMEGITVYNLRGEATVDDRKEVTSAYVDILELPVYLDELKGQLEAMGVDLDALVSLASRVIGERAPEDLQALSDALQERIARYFWAFEVETAVEPKTGVPVNVYEVVETLYMELDEEKLTDIFRVLAAYADDPELGPELQKLLQLQSEMAGEGPSKIFEYSYQQTEDTVKQAIEDSKESIGRINLVKVYIPWALLIVGALVLIIGLLMGGSQVPPQVED